MKKSLLTSTLILLLSASTCFAIGFSKCIVGQSDSANESNSLKTWEDEWTMAQAGDVEIDVWLSDVPEPLITAGVWIEYDASQMDIVSANIDSVWDAGMSQILKNPFGPGTYMITVGNLSNVKPDENGDIDIATILVQCLTGNCDGVMTFGTIPDQNFDSVVGNNGGVYDGDISPNYFHFDSSSTTTTINATWFIEGVDTPPVFLDAFSTQEIAIASDGVEHIVYGGIHLYHAYNAGEGWNYEVVDNAREVGKCTSFVLDSNDKLHISYFDDTNNILKYATNASGSWVIETVDSGESLGRYSSIAIDSHDKVYISYRDELVLGWESHLKYATNASGSWVIETVDSEGFVGERTSIALDLDNKIHIGYTFLSHLKYATNASGLWVTEIVDSEGYVVDRTSLSLDTQNKAHISYNNSNRTLKYATNASGFWMTETVDSEGYVGKDSSISLDSKDKVHISYWDGNDTLAYTTNASGSWVKETLDNDAGNGDTYNTSIVLDQQDKAHISYYNGTSYSGDGYLKYATNASGSWRVETVESAGVVGRDSSIALDSQNKIHITYRGSNFARYANNVSGSWIIEIIDNEERLGFGPMVLDSQDKMHISYGVYRYDNTNFMYASNASGSWVTEIVDSQIAGKYSSIALDSNDKVHISYQEESSYLGPNKENIDASTLKYATNASGSWVTETVDSEDPVGFNTSLTLDSQGRVHISYFEYGYLKYATNASGPWITLRVDRIEGSCKSGGAATSISCDSHDNLYIVYNGSSGGIKYAWCNRYCGNTENWNKETVDSEGEGYSSLSLDLQGRAHISYYGDNNLKYATNTSGTWVIETVDSNQYVGSGTSIVLDGKDNPHISYYDSYNYDLKYARQVCDLDFDCDEVLDDVDNCPNDYNPNQSDNDQDGFGDSCDLDDDNDEVEDLLDNCPLEANPNQEDRDEDGKGDVCDLCSVLQIFGEDSKAVQLLRDFRDNVLTQTPEGRKLIEIYYEWSTVIVKALEEDEDFREEITELIDEVLPLVEKAME
jgi:hypothetical protein